jgi:hypothetical protein
MATGETKPTGTATVDGIVGTAITTFDGKLDGRLFELIKTTDGWLEIVITSYGGNEKPTEAGTKTGLGQNGGTTGAESTFWHP